MLIVRDTTPKYVPVAPVREAFLASGLRPSELARRLGYFNCRREADTSRVRHDLGLRLSHSLNRQGRRYAAPKRHISERKMYAYLDALGLDPVDVGL